MDHEARVEFGGWARVAWPPPLAGDELHVWRVAVHRPPEVLAAWRAALTADEQARLGRFHFPDDATRELVSRGALRSLLGGYLGRAGAELAFATEGRGKPVLAGGPPAGRVEFNASHSGDWVLLGFARGRPLGIDVERWRELNGAELVRDYFSPAEFAEWQAVPPAERTAAFFHGWTRKEAYLKALGLGLAKPLASFQVRLAPRAVPAVVADAENPRAAAEWQLHDVPVAPGYAGAVAVARGAAPVRWFELA